MARGRSVWCSGRGFELELIDSSGSPGGGSRGGGDTRGAGVAPSRVGGDTVAGLSPSRTGSNAGAPSSSGVASPLRDFGPPSAKVMESGRSTLAASRSARRRGARNAANAADGEGVMVLPPRTPAEAVVDGGVALAPSAGVSVTSTATSAGSRGAASSTSIPGGAQGAPARQPGGLSRLAVRRTVAPL